MEVLKKLKTQSPYDPSIPFLGIYLEKNMVSKDICKDIQWKKDSLFNKWCWENWSTTYKRMKPEHFLNTIHKNKLKMD